MKYLYLYGKTKSREYRDAKVCVSVGMGFITEPGFEYRVAVDGTKGRLRSRDSAVRRATDLVRRRPIGSTVRVQRVRQREDGTIVVKDEIRFRKVDPLPVADTPGVEGIDRWCGYLNKNFAGTKTFRYAGICVCKPNSDHRDCAACDHFDTWDNMRATVQWALANRDYLNLKYIILGDTIWSSTYNFAPRNYTGDYHSHVHISVFGGRAGSAC